MATDGGSGPRLASDKGSAGATVPVPAAMKRKAEGHGTSSGQYMKPYPNPSIFHEQFAFPLGNICTGATTTFEIEVPANTVAR